MGRGYVYDNASFHAHDVVSRGLPASHASHHTAMFLRWVIERNLLKRSIRDQLVDLKDYLSVGPSGILRIYEEFDNKLTSDVLSGQGNAFARKYFDFEVGKYILDYEECLMTGEMAVHPDSTIYDVELSEANYIKLKQVLDSRFADWLAGKSVSQTAAERRSFRIAAARLPKSAGT